MKKTVIVWTIACCLASLSCNNAEKQQTVAAQETSDKSVKTDTIAALPAQRAGESNTIEVDEVITGLPVKNFVVMDSTSFNNYQAEGVADDAFIKKIKFQVSNPHAEHFRLRYKVPYSKNFDAIVITYRDGEHELITTLVTLDKHGHIIDQLDIAYDEVAESAFSKIGKLEKDRISIQNWNYMNEVPLHEETTFAILETGKFKPIK